MDFHDPKHLSGGQAGSVLSAARDSLISIRAHSHFPFRFLSARESFVLSSAEREHDTKPRNDLQLVEGTAPNRGCGLENPCIFERRLGTLGETR